MQISSIRSNNISFGSTFLIKQDENESQKYWKIYDMYDEVGPKSDVKIINAVKVDKFSGKDSHESIIIADDKDDFDIETFLKRNSIRYYKKYTQKLLSADSIVSRIEIPNSKYSSPRYLPEPVFVNTDKFDEAFKETTQYVGDYESMSDSSKYRYNNFIDYIKQDRPIFAPEVYIKEQFGDPVFEITSDCGKARLRARKSYGEPEICFQDGRHRYAVLRDLVLKQIPVAMKE